MSHKLWRGLALACLLAGCLQLKGPKLTVREPAAAGEATIDYQPPPDPAFPLEMVAGNPMIAAMIRPKIRRVTDTVYLATGYALGNSALVITRDGLVVIDATESPDAAAKILAEYRKLSKLPVRYLVYTHGHPDHFGGARVFQDGGGTRIIAARSFLDFTDWQDRLLHDQQRRARATQAGMLAPSHAFAIPVGDNPFKMLNWEPPVKPDITFDTEYSFELGGRRFELFATSGETPDHLAVWLPDEKVLFPGDLFYASFPNLSTPMLEARPVRGWISSLDRFLQYDADYLVPSHTLAVAGAAEIRETLKNYREAIAYVHDETVKCVNAGKTVDEAVAEIRLPERLARLPYLQEYYGRVGWSVRGMYRGYTGWYDGNGTGLNPLPPGHAAREVVALAGVDKVLARAIALQKDGQHQLAAELCDLVIAANPDEKLAHRIKAASMMQLGFGYQNLNCFGFYRSAYAREMQLAGEPPRQ